MRGFRPFFDPFQDHPSAWVIRRRGIPQHLAPIALAIIAKPSVSM
jgi:hypothetical protein